MTDIEIRDWLASVARTGGVWVVVGPRGDDECLLVSMDGRVTSFLWPDGANLLTDFLMRHGAPSFANREALDAWIRRRSRVP